MVVFLSAFYQYVFHVDLNVPPNLMFEHIVHHPLICGACVLEFKWHYFVIEETLANDE